MSTITINPARTDAQGNTRVQNVSLWVVQVLLAAVFLGAGYAKLSGAPEMVQNFELLGFGQWFRYLTGGIEVAAALLLLVPRLAAVGALLLAGTMAGAVATHLLALPGSPVPALVLGALSAIVAWGRRAQLPRLLGR
jgi:uncharacterized membrane protein YphA (DoxX/SURF4 family)